MQMITDFFKMLSDVFRIVSRTTKPVELLVEQTTYNLVTSRDEARINAAKSKKELMKNSGVTAKELADLDAELWG